MAPLSKRKSEPGIPLAIPISPGLPMRPSFTTGQSEPLLMDLPKAYGEKPPSQAAPPGMVLSQSMAPSRPQASPQDSDNSVNLRDFVLPMPPSPIVEAGTPPPRKQSRVELRDELRALGEGNDSSDDDDDDAYGIRVVSYDFLCVAEAPGKPCVCVSTHAVFVHACLPTRSTSPTSTFTGQNGKRVRETPV